MLNEVADGVWVRQSEWVWSNAVVVRGDEGLILVDPGIDGSDLTELADDLDGLGRPVVAGFSTHPHWDHLLWHPRFGDVPRYATAAGAQRERGARASPGHGGGERHRHPARPGRHPLPTARGRWTAAQHDVVVPGHRAVARGPDVAARL